MITIVGMKMPENCEQCRFSILMRDDVYCTAMNGETTLLYEDDWHLKRPERCPLQEEVTANKEIPIKPVNRVFWYFCKVCNTVVERQDKYCRGCGQKLDWSRDEKM